MDKLRAKMNSKGKRSGRANRDGDSFESRRTIREEIRALNKDVRVRERDVVRDILRHADVVLATCIGAGSKLLKDTYFDMVVVDEAAQGLEAACWIPILRMRPIDSPTRSTCVLAGEWVMKGFYILQ